jgi:predicted nucleotidyltransferase
MLTGADPRIAEKLKERFLGDNGARIRRVILYGSRARGAATPESDFDVLVVEADPVSKREEMQRLAKAVEDAGVPVHVWAKGGVGVRGDEERHRRPGVSRPEIRRRVV